MQQFNFSDLSIDSNKTVIHLAHANGFPPETYREMVAALGDQYQVICFPARPLWEDPPDYEDFNRWQIMGDDLIKALDQANVGPVIGVGHSMGGSATIMAALKRPDLFSKLIMLDPVLFPRSLIWMMTLIPQWLPHPEIPLVEKALRRKREWDSKEAAFERFRPRRLFIQWSDDTLRSYIEGITQEADDGGIELRYTPEWEAQIYRTSMYSLRGWWNWLKKLTVPTAAIQGENTDTFLPRAVNLWQNVRPDFPVDQVAECGHLFPMEAPHITAKKIEGFIQKL